MPKARSSPNNTSRLGLNLIRFGSDGIATPKFIELAGPAADGIYFTAHFSVATTTDIAVAKDFVAKFRKAYGRDPDSYAAEAYDAATMAVMAVEASDKLDRASVRDALAKVSFESSRGTFKFDDKGDPLLVTHVVKIVDGKETNARNMPVQN